MKQLTVHCIKEMKYYKKSYLEKKIFGKKNFSAVIKTLRAKGVVKLTKSGTKKSDQDGGFSTQEEEIELSENDSLCRYVFQFVGILIIQNVVLKCYPKYVHTKLRKEKFNEKFNQVIKVIKHYKHRKKQEIYVFEEDADHPQTNRLSILLALLFDYYEKGVYTNAHEVRQVNGTGEIDWDRTVNNTLPIFIHHRPYYVELQTRKQINDPNDYFTQLHEYVLSKITQELKDAGLLKVFGLPELDLSERQSIDDFGGKDYVKYRLKNELRIQFNTRKQFILKTILHYIRHKKGWGDQNSLSFYGTTHFNLVWEDVCAVILGNQLERPLGDLFSELEKDYESKSKPKSKPKSSDRLSDLIEKPYWTLFNKESATFIPDVICIDNGYFIIFDAKYYNPTINENKKLKGQPGIDSIAKQYLYQLAYQDFIQAHCLKAKNCFLLPTEQECVVNAGQVELKMLSGLRLENIDIRFLPAQEAYNLYLSGKRFCLQKLELDKSIEIKWINLQKSIEKDAECPDNDG